MFLKKDYIDNNKNTKYNMDDDDIDRDPGELMDDEEGHDDDGMHDERNVNIQHLPYIQQDMDMDLDVEEDGEEEDEEKS